MSTVQICEMVCGGIDVPAPKRHSLPTVYPRLRRLARQFLLSERQGHTLQPTALVHEAFLRLLDQREPARDDTHYVALAAQMMRRILINHALSRKAEKRGGSDAVHVPLDDDLPAAAFHAPDSEMFALGQALEELDTLDSRQAQIVHLRFFCGLSIEETAQELNVSVATVKRDWLTARIWLQHRLKS